MACARRSAEDRRSTSNVEVDERVDVYVAVKVNDGPRSTSKFNVNHSHPFPFVRRLLSYEPTFAIGLPALTQPAMPSGMTFTFL